MGVTIDRASESGVAVRVSRAGDDHAGFAAASGLSPEVVRWAVDMASTFDAQAPSAAPRPSDTIVSDRRDLDPHVGLPSEEVLSRGVKSRPKLEWIEVGTTVEVLIGAEEWTTARRRHRFWALGADPYSRLVAQRGFAGWEALVDESGIDESAPASASTDLGVITLTRNAAGPIVAALVEAFHGPASVPPMDCGGGWDVSDEPVRPDGLVGGTFDDAGFPSISRPLAAKRLWLGKLSGPGTFHRSSFREPPRESATNLCIPSGTAESRPTRAALARRCRVLQLSQDLWVLELDLVSHPNRGEAERRWIRVQPQALVAACTSRVGCAKVTPGGPIVPGLSFEGLVTE
jgi:hypothetical protein